MLTIRHDSTWIERLVTANDDPSNRMSICKSTSGMAGRHLLLRVVRFDNIFNPLSQTLTNFFQVSCKLTSGMRIRRESTSGLTIRQLPLTIRSGLGVLDNPRTFLFTSSDASKKNVMSTQRARFSKFVFRSFSMVGLSWRLRNIWHVPVKFLFTFEIISAGHFNEINIILNLLSVINGIGSSCTDAACDSVACALWRLNRWSRRRLDVPRTHIVIGWFFCYCLQHRWSNFDLLSLMLRMDDVTINNLPCYHIKQIDSVLPWVSTRSHKPSKCNFLVLNTFWRHLSFIADHEQTHGNTG